MGKTGKFVLILPSYFCGHPGYAKTSNQNLTFTSIRDFHDLFVKFATLIIMTSVVFVMTTCISTNLTYFNSKEIKIK